MLNDQKHKAFLLVFLHTAIMINENGCKNCPITTPTPPTTPSYFEFYLQEIFGNGAENVYDFGGMAV